MSEFSLAESLSAIDYFSDFNIKDCFPDDIFSALLSHAYEDFLETLKRCSDGKVCPQKAETLELKLPGKKISFKVYQFDR